MKYVCVRVCAYSPVHVRVHVCLRARARALLCVNAYATLASIIYIYTIQIMCVCVVLSSIGGQTAGPIMTKVGTHMRIDLVMVPT